MLNKKRFSVPFSLGLVFVLLSVFVCSSFADFTTENVLDGGFEASGAYWVQETGLSEFSAVEFHAGAFSKMDSMDDSWSGSSFYQVLSNPILESDAGHLSFWLKSSGEVSIMVYLYFTNFGPTCFMIEQDTWADWTLYNFTIQGYSPELIGDSITHVWFWFSCLGGSNYVWLDDVSISSEAGSSTSGGDAGSEELIGSLAQVLVPLTVVCIPVLFFVVVCKLGSWGAIIGLAIGVGLAYAFLPAPYQIPLWVVFLVAVGEFGLIYKSRGGG